MSRAVFRAGEAWAGLVLYFDVGFLENRARQKGCVWKGPAFVL